MDQKTTFRRCHTFEQAGDITDTFTNTVLGHKHL